MKKIKLKDTMEFAYFCMVMSNFEQVYYKLQNYKKKRTLCFCHYSTRGHITIY